NPNPNRHVVKLICTKEAVVSYSFTMVGKEGKYVSMVKGPNNERDPNSNASCNRFVPVNLFNISLLSIHHFPFRYARLQLVHFKHYRVMR
ncbi:MAG: hypothetical protein K0S80_5155, partial [Neobacillus sp.]|nr:hypothetical protein [Neobacillus sp.]